MGNLLRMVRRAALVVALAAVCGWGMPAARAGVMVEGSAVGVPHVVTLSYDAGANRFVLNGTETVGVSVSREELTDILAALKLDDRLGVSVKLDNEVIVYGRLNKRSPAAKKMENADNFFRAVVFAEGAMLKGVVLPGNYQPKSPRVRERASVIYLKMDDFKFLHSGSAYYPNGVNASVVLVPMAKYTAPDGGYLPDYDALEKDEYQKEDKENADHIQQYKSEYIKMEVIANAIRVGEAAALVRHFRDSGINLDELQQSVEKGDGKVLQGNPAPAVADLATAQPAAAAAPAAPVAAVAAVPAVAVANPENQKTVSADNIRRVMAQEISLGSGDRVKLTRGTVNDGTYVAFRQEYLKSLGQIDTTGCPAEFIKAFAAYRGVWTATLQWMDGKKIEDGAEAFTAFSEAHAPYRKDLRNTYNECKRIAAEYGVMVE